MTVKRSFLLFSLLIVCGGWAQTSYLLTQFPKSARSAKLTDTIAWTGAARPLFTAPDSGNIYFSRSPGGSVIKNYGYKIENFYVDTQSNGSRILQDNIYIPGVPPQRRIIFKPSEQTNMGYGLFYYIVGFNTKVLGIDTMFASNELEMIVESPNPVTQISPSDSITSLTPTFQWAANPGVPYYHIILSDEALNINTVNGEMSIEGVSICWQAITPNTQIVYGAPDPSGTITADPPPLSPGKTYYWAVLNNYKNSALYSSSKIGLPLSFTVKGTPLLKAKNISPKNVTLSSARDSVVTFKWTNMDNKANTYKIYLYVNSDVSQVSAKLVVWSNEVTASTFSGSNGIVDSTDTAFVTINARSVLSKNHYTWKVFAIDNQGASTCGDTSSFEYADPSTGHLDLYTIEKIVSSTTLPTGVAIDTTLSAVPIVLMNVEVVNGSSEAPVLFYTDLSGSLSRERPSGVYRITTSKSGFEPFTKTISLDSGMVVNDTFFLKRPDATVYGKVVDNTNIGINVADVYAVSDRNDTVIAQTDALGSFIVNCYEGSWRVYAQKSGYVTSIPKQVEVVYGQSYSFGSIALALNPFTVSGTIKNENGDPVLGVDVKVISEGITIAETPSTPQTGTFSFSLSSGTYTIYATKTGFETYSNLINVSGSMQLSITMPSGAAMIKGYVIGATWIGKNLVYAPVTKASILFTDTTAPAKTFSATTDATYGDYATSVTGNRLFTSIVSAAGFLTRTETLQSKTTAGNTMIYNDTIRSMGMITGNVVSGNSRAAVDNATITVLNPQTSRVMATGTSQANGYFEIRGLADGICQVKAGAPGYVADSIRASDTFYVSNGKTTVQGDSAAGDGLTIFMSPGEKIISWVIVDAAGKNDTSATVSIKSPIQKIIRAGKSLTGAGYGDYIVYVNSTSDSVLDCSYHLFTVAPSESIHVDSVRLSLINRTDTSLAISHDSISVLLYAALQDTMDSAAIFYRDINSTGFSTIVDKNRAVSYNFKFVPPKDGSTLNYYFKAYRGKDVFGSATETFYTYIQPDTARLSKLALVPSTVDTALLGAKSQLKIKILGYFGSTFISAPIKDSTAISWKLLNAPKGTKLTDSTGTDVIIATGSDSSVTTATLRATIDTSKQRISPQLPSPEVSFHFMVSSKTVSSIIVGRIDAGSPNPITTSSLSSAEFSACGLDAANRTLTVSPVWSIAPSNAGSISTLGVFKPVSCFSGNVRIYAQTGNITGEYNAEGASEKQYGLEVEHLVTARTCSDTAGNYRGCTIILPDSVVSADNPGLLQIAMPTLSNRLQLSTGSLTVTGSVYDITEKNGINLNIGNKDSIKLVLDIPDAAVKNISGSGYKLYVGLWDADSLQWSALPNSVINSSAKTISANLSHFSRYAILVASTKLTSTLSILPNPFSPDKKASDFSALSAKFGKDTPKGTCIMFTPEAADATIQQVRISIYNIVGEQVAKVIMQDATKLTEYHLWWDGRTTERTGVSWDELKSVSSDANGKIMSGDKMCRNGRYFVTLTVKDFSGNEKNYMKQAVLIK